MPRILIAGAGIGGLTAAIALAKGGIDVTLVERAAELAAIGAGVQLSPNATRILDRLGVLETISDHALRPARIRVRGARGGRTIVDMPLADAEHRWGAPYLVVHRGDLQRALCAAATADPAISLQLATALAGFGIAASGVLATTKQGQITRTIKGDALVGADGIRSTVRDRLADGDDPPRETGRTAWRALVPAEAVDPMFRAPETALWLGRKAHLVHYPLDKGRRINVVAITQREAAPAIDLWSTPGDPAAIQARFRGWHETARRLIAAAPAWSTWPLFDRSPLATWSAGPIALLGDAAHPILPFLAQGAAQAIEDAAALAAAVAKTRDLSAAFAAYSAARQTRARQVQETSRELGRLYHLGGPAAAARNAGMRWLGGQRLLARYDWLYAG